MPAHRRLDRSPTPVPRREGRARVRGTHHRGEVPAAVSLPVQWDNRFAAKPLAGRRFWRCIMVRNLMAAVVLLALGGVANAQYPSATSKPNLFGGYDYSNGWSSRSTPGGGFSYHGPFGQQGGHSTPNAMGGLNHYRPFGQFDGYSTPNAMGGFNSQKPFGQPGGYSTPNT